MLHFTVVRNGTKQSLKLGPASHGSQSTVYGDWLTIPSFQYTFHKFPLLPQRAITKFKESVGWAIDKFRLNN